MAVARRIRILVVDDEPPARARLRTLLAREEGVELLGECENGADAIAAIERDAPDLVFLDVEMPGLDGFTLCQGLKGNRVTQNIPLVLLTGSDKINDIEKGFAAGAAVYLLKPVDWMTAWPKLEPYLKD